MCQVALNHCQLESQKLIIISPTASHCATSEDQCDAARVLIKNGAKLDVKNQDNTTPIDSCKTKKLKAELMLIKADKQIRDFITLGFNVLVGAISKLNCSKKKRHVSDKCRIKEEGDRGR